MKLQTKRKINLTLAAIMATSGSSAYAEETTDQSTTSFTQAIKQTKPIIDVRLRYEHVEQDNIANDAEAITLRSRAGIETGAFLDTTLLIEGEGIVALNENYNSTVNGKTRFPVVADPQDHIELNRFQLTNKSLPQTTITLGRQRIILDDARFVGNVGWRQNEQTFDGVMVSNNTVENLTVKAAYILNVNRIFGERHPAGDFDGDTVLLNATYNTKIGGLTAFAYLVDLEDAIGLSSQTYGFRFTGKKEIDAYTFDYIASYARQSDYERNPTPYDVNYYNIEAAAARAGFSVGAGYEVLGGDGVKAFTTPLATLHKFQGYADVFLATPPGGIEDLYVKAGYTVKDVGPFSMLKFAATYHEFKSEETSLEYGDEIDAVFIAKLKKSKRTQFTLKYANFDGNPAFGAADRSKVWASIDFKF